jgi:hypothetical protein
MTIKEAIDIVEDIGFYVPLLDSQKEALNKLIQTAKDYDELIMTIPIWRCNPSYSCKEIGEALHKVAESVGGHGGYIVSAEDIHTALERDNEKRRRNSTAFGEI